MVIRKIKGMLPITVRLIVLPACEPGDGGEVTIETPAGRRVVVALKRRYFRVLQLLFEACFEDSGVESDLRGVRTVNAIVRAYAAQIDEVATMQRGSLRRYVNETRAAFDRAFEEVADEIGCSEIDWGQAVIKTIVRRGYQIGAVSFVYIDYTANPPAASSPSSTLMSA